MGTGRKVSGLSPFGLGGLTKTGNIISGTGATLAFFDDELTYATLEMMQEEGGARVVSKPRILVNHNESGTIDSKRQEPTTKTTVPAGSDTPIIDFAGYEDAGTTLTIKPLVSAGEDNFLQLEIKLDVNNFEGESSGNVPPPKVSNSVDTVVALPDGKAIVLGGLTTRVESTTVNKIPILGDIPLLGSAFRNVVKGSNEVVLYVFVRANIVRNRAEFEALSAEHEKRLREIEQRPHPDVVPGVHEEREVPSALDEE